MVEIVKTRWELPRIGSYYLPEASTEGSRPGPALDGATARLLWQQTLDRREGLIARRREFPTGSPVDAATLRRLVTLEIKCIEAALDLLHRIAAPGERVCGPDCPHLGAGISPEKAGRYLESLRAAVQRLESQMQRSRSPRLRLEYEAEAAAFRRLFDDFLSRATRSDSPP